MVEGLVVKDVRKQVIDSMPGPEKVCVISETLETLRVIKTSTAVFACKPAVLKEIDSVISFLVGLLEGASPSFSSMSNLSDFMKGVLTLAENFLTTTTKRPLPGKLGLGTVTLVGRAALEVMFAAFTQHQGADEVSDVGRHIQAFSWLLTVEQKKVLNAKLGQIVKARRSLLSTKALPAPLLEGGSYMEGGSSASTSVLAVKTLSPALFDPSAMSSKEVAKVAADTAARQRLRAILKGKTTS